MKHKIHIQAPIETVFDWIENNDKVPLWMEGLESTEYTSNRDPKNLVGTTFKQRMTEFGRTVEYAGEITDHQFPHNLAVRLKHPRFTMHVTYKLNDTSQGVCLQYQVELVEGDGVVSKLTKMMDWYLKKVASSQLKKIKQLAEQDVSSGSPR